MHGTAEAIAYLRSIGAPEIFDDLTCVLLENRPSRDEVFRFIAQQAMLLEGKHGQSKDQMQSRALSQLPYAKTLPAASAIFACAQSTGAGWFDAALGVVDLGLTDPKTGEVPARWQVRCTVEHNPFGACPVTVTDIWDDAAGQEAAQVLADLAQEFAGSTSPRRRQAAAVDSTPPMQPAPTPVQTPLTDAVAEMLDVMEGSVQTCVFQDPCPRELAAQVVIGARATDFEKGVLVVRNGSRWKYGDLDGGGEGLVLGVGKQLAGAKSNIRVRWPSREYVHHRDDRSLRLSQMSAWRATVDLRRAAAIPGKAIGSDGAVAVARVLKLGVPLRELLLRNNQIDDHGAAALLDAVKCNKSITQVDLGSGLDDVVSIGQKKRLGSIRLAREDWDDGGALDRCGPDVQERTYAADIKPALQASLLVRCAFNAAVEQGGTISLRFLYSLGNLWVESVVDALWDVDELLLPCGDLALRESVKAAEVLTSLLERRGKAGMKTPKQCVLLFAAADGCNPEIFDDDDVNPGKLLNSILADGGDAEERDARGRSPLHLAAEHGKVVAARELLRHSVDVTSLCDGRVPAFYAALHPKFHQDESAGKGVLKQMATAAALAVRGTSESFPGAGDGGPPDHFTALHAAAWEGSCAAVKCLVDFGASVNCKSERGHYPLSIAARSAAFDDDPDGLKPLAPAEVLHATDSKGRSALHWACNKGRYRSAHHLAKLGADVELQAKSGRTPLHEAMRDLRFDNEQGAEALVSLITAGTLKATAEEASSSAHTGSTALHSAGYFGRDKLIRVLVQLGASVHTRDTQGHTPLHRAAARGHVRALEALLELGSDANATTPEGKTALNIAEASPSVWQGKELEQVRRLFGKPTTAPDQPVSQPKEPRGRVVFT